MVVLYTGINLQRSPFQALVADLLPSRYRSLATGVGDVSDVRRRHRVPDAGAGARHAAGLPDRGGHRARHRRGVCVRPARASRVRSARPQRRRSDRSLDASWARPCAATLPGLRAIFLAALLLQLTFQTFSTWFALHGTERFGVRPEDVAIGFIAWAIGGVIGALPAGAIGVRIGRRNAMLLGFGADGCVPARARSRHDARAGHAAAGAGVGELDAADRECLSALHRARSRASAGAARGAVPAVHGARRRHRRSAQRRLFDLFGGYRPLFLMMAVYTALAFLAVLLVPRGTGEPTPAPSGLRPPPGERTLTCGRYDCEGMLCPRYDA